MKSLKLTIIAFFAFATVANAQLYVGGSFGINSKSSTSTSGTTSVSGPSSFSFGLAPEVGFFLSEKLAIGGRIGLQTTSNKTYANDADRTVTKQTQTTFGITPYANYYFLQAGNFSVFAEANLPIGFGGSSVSTGTVTTKGPSIFNFGINLLPGLAYKVNERILLRTQVNFLNIGFNLRSESTTITNPVDNTTITSSIIKPEFNFGANMNNVATLGAISIGAIFIF